VSDLGDYLAAIVPTIGVAALFYFIIKAMMEGDRRERLAQSTMDAEDRHGAASQSPSAAQTETLDAAPDDGAEKPTDSEGPAPASG
jgi:hypothetical protein